MENLNSHLKLYYEPFKQNLVLKREIDSMQVDLNFMNLDLNFFTTNYPLQEASRGVLIDFSNK